MPCRWKGWWIVPRIRNRKFETFNDGILQLYKAKERKLLSLKGSGIRFGDKTVGIKRFHNVRVEGSQCDRLVSIPMNPLVKRQDVVVIGGCQYTILQIQEKFDQDPPYLLLSLQENKIAYRRAENVQKSET